MPSFLDLPPEIRLMIYDYSLNPNEYVKSYRKIVKTVALAATGPPLSQNPRLYVTRYTPPVLLLNKKIMAEALPVLYRKPLDLYGTPSTYFTMRQMDISEFISEHLLQQIQYSALRLYFPNKTFVLALLDIWGAGNQLIRLDVYLPEQAARNNRHWDIVESRLRTFSTMVPVEWHETVNSLKEN
ncbi:hypothetical protein N7494_003540 [Penicillium frequentans]|uniref:2EXR domain-containing protein n=1 Tax=Penicillium frequentans TaxID=3151616 RepID=A0AAD6GFT1_9EURO|nr:hypothetical protein N7494_003540 [Penicillium glabrum]